MASLLLDKVVIGSCSSSSKSFLTGQQLFASAAAPAEVDCCFSVSGRRSRSEGASRAALRGLQSRGDFSPWSSVSPPWPSDEFSCASSRGSLVNRLRQNDAPRGRGGRRENRFATMAVPVDSYWITAAEAVAVAGLMGGIAIMTGILINIRIEVQALAEYQELEEKGLLPDEIVIPDEDFDVESPLYIFQTKELQSSSPSRNRPVREEFQPELEAELKTELEVASKE